MSNLRKRIKIRRCDSTSRTAEVNNWGMEDKIVFHCLTDRDEEVEIELGMDCLPDLVVHLMHELLELRRLTDRRIAAVKAASEKERT